MWTYNKIYPEYYTASNGVKYSFDPTLPVPVAKEDPDYGRTLQQVVGMSDTEVASIILEAKWTQIRLIRDKLLADSDWTQGRDVPVNIYEPWAVYRDALRNLTTAATPEDVVFPTAPQS